MVARRALSELRLGSAVFGVLLFLMMVNVAAGLNINYCSSQLTASDDPVDNPYQSNGACQTSCKGSAYAVIKGHQCWCSNYAPAQQGDTGSCDSNCPGFPSEKCGSPTNNLYAYFQIGNNVAGTQGASSASPTSVSQVTASDTPSAAPSTTPASPSVGTSSATVTLISTPTWTPTPFASVTTVLGSIQTVIITPSPPPQPVQTDTATINAAPAPDSFWSDTGKVAGTFVAVALVIVAAAAVAIFFMLRRMRRRNEVMAVGSNADDDNPYMIDRRRSNLNLTTGGGLARGNSNEKPGSQEHTPATVSRRTSMPLVHDQRLNPAALWSPVHDNGSHVSVASFRDDRDYSRPVLHVRNPDSE